LNLQRNDRFTLVEALDRLIDKGVSVTGDVSISVADVDLVYLGLRVLLSSAEDVPALRQLRRTPEATALPNEAEAGSRSIGDPVEHARTLVDTAPRASEPPPTERTRERSVIDVRSGKPAEAAPHRLLDIDPSQIERDLTRLVLTIVELLRQLMERQALRRMEGGTLDDDSIERVGTAFARLDEKMDELRTVFGLNEEDLNIDLGPLGTLV